MINNTLKRLATGLGLALVLALVTVAIGRAQDAEPPLAPDRGIRLLDEHDVAADARTLE